MPRIDTFIDTFREWTSVFMHRSMSGYHQYVREKGLSFSSIGTLHHLRRIGHVSVSDLGEHLGISSAAASQMLDRLVEEGLISRSEDPQDRRMKRLALTEEGYRILDGSLNARLSWLMDLAHRFSDEEKEQLTEALRLMIEKAREVEIAPEKG